MRLGINLPSSAPARAMGAAYDFGRVFDRGGREVVAAWKARGGRHLLDELEAMYAVGVRALRWFVLGGGATLGRPGFIEGTNRFGPADGAEARLLREGAGEAWYAAGQWSFAMPGAPECAAVVADLVRMLRLVRGFNAVSEARRRDPIRVLPSWVDFRFFMGPGALRLEWDTPTENDRANYRLDEPGEVELWFALRALEGSVMVPGGRMDVLLDAAQRGLLYRRVMIPTLQAVAREPGLREQVLCWEVGNELDALLAGAPAQTISRATDASLPGVARLTRAVYRFVSEVIALRRGHPVRVGGATLRADVGEAFRTTVGWLRWDGGAGLQQSLRDRRWLRDHPRAAGGPTEVEDVLQYHAYMAMHADERPVVYVPPGASRGETFSEGLCAALGAAPHNELTGGLSVSGWRAWPSAQEVREAAAAALGDALHQTMNLPPDLAVRFDNDAHLPCVVGEMHLLPASGDTREGRAPERWVKHFSTPWVAWPGGRPFCVRPVRLDAALGRYVQIAPMGLGARAEAEFPWAYEDFMDHLTGRLLMLHTLGYSWALPWAWNLGPVERPLEFALTPGDGASRAGETPEAFWRRLRLGEQLLAFVDAMRAHEGGGP